MRRRVLPLLLTAAAAVVALVRRSRRREAVAQPRYVDSPPSVALEAASTPDEAAIAEPTADHDIVPDPQVEGEGTSRPSEDDRLAQHNAAPELAPATRPATSSPFRSVAWQLLGEEPPAAEATELRIGFSLVGRYESLARVDVRETDSQVFVTVLARFDPPEGGWFAYAEAHQATVTLSRPLGDRALVHAPVSPDPSADPPAG